MTCIVGVVNKDKVYLGCDSFSVGPNVNTEKNKKIFRRGDMIIGGAGSWRMLHLLEYHLEPIRIKKGKDVREHLITDTVPEIREMFKEEGWLGNDDGRDEGGLFLIGGKGRLFCIQGDFAVLENAEGYDSIGSGSYYALPALHLLRKLEPSKRVKKSLEVAEKFSTGVQGPFFIKSA